MIYKNPLHFHENQLPQVNVTTIQNYQGCLQHPLFELAIPLFFITVCREGGLRLREKQLGV